MPTRVGTERLGVSEGLFSFGRPGPFLAFCLQSPGLQKGGALPPPRGWKSFPLRNREYWTQNAGGGDWATHFCDGNSNGTHSGLGTFPWRVTFQCSVSLSLCNWDRVSIPRPFGSFRATPFSPPLPLPLAVKPKGMVWEVRRGPLISNQTSPARAQGRLHEWQDRPRSNSGEKSLYGDTIQMVLPEHKGVCARDRTIGG